MVIIGIAKILFISFCLLRYSATSVNTLKTQRTSEIVRSMSIIAPSPTSVQQRRSGIVSTIGLDVLHRPANKRNRTQTFSDPAKTETFNGGSLKLLPTVTVIAPDNQNSREKTFSQLVLSSSKIWTTASTLPSAGSNQNTSSIYSKYEQSWKFDEIVTPSSSAIYLKPALPDTDKIDTAYSDTNNPPIYIKDNPSVYVNDKSSITVRREPITFTEEKLTTKSPIYIKNKDKDEEKLTTKSPPYIEDKDEEKLTTKSPPHIEIKEKEKLTTQSPPYIEDKDEENLTTQSPPYIEGKNEEKLTTKLPPCIEDKEKLPTKSPPYIEDKDEEKSTTQSPPYIEGKNEEKSTTKSPPKIEDKDEKLLFKEDKIEEEILIIMRPEPPQCSSWASASCKDRCGFERQFGDKWSCFCDPDCNVFKDCCADFDEYCNATIMLEGWVESEFDKRWDCWTLYHDDMPIWMIGQCQPGWNDADVLRRCTEKNSDIISEVIPVIDQYKNTFFNRYCAICNNVTEFSQWEFKVYCDVIPPAGYTEAQWTTFLDLFCSIDSFSLTQTWGKRYCVDDVHSNCSIWDDDETVEGCLFGLTGLVTVPSNYDHYRNWDCLLCNYFDGHSLPFTVCGPTAPIVRPVVPDLEISISYSSIFRASSLPLPQSKCPQHQIYDETFAECKPLLARNNINFGEVLKKYAVILEYKEHSNSCGIYLFTAGLESANSTTRLKDVSQKLLEINLMERDSKVLGINIQPLGNFSYRVIFELLENSEENELVESNIGHELKIQNLAFHSHIRNLTRSNGLCKYSLNRSIVREMLCAENETVSLNEVEIYGNKSVFINKTGQLYSAQEYLLFKNEKRLALCKDYWPGNCSYYIEVKNESDWSIFENGSVHTDVTKVSWLHYGQYTIVDGVLRFCSRYPRAVLNSKTSIHETILSHATTVCLSVSIISSTVLLIVYSKFPALRNLPGKNLMLFSSILAFSQLLWLLQTYIASLSSTLCVVTAFALQYFLLASFSCSTSIAFHSLMTFLKIAKGKLTQSSSGKFLYYVLYSLGLPLLLLLICWILHYYNILTIVQYQHNCWFKTDLSIFIAFYIPAFTMLLFNFVLISKTMMFLRDCTNERRNLAEKTGAPTKIQIGIYLRMSTIMGATWLFGVFIMIFPDVVVFQYLFVFINGLQGFYISFAFLFTDNVKKIIVRGNNRGTSTWKCNNSRSMYSATTL
jgi:hypothetical protein